MEYQNLSLIAGIPASFDFEAVDDTGLDLDLTDTTLKFEVRNLRGDLVIAKTFLETTTVSLLSADSLTLGQDRFSYRAVLLDINLAPISEIFQGFLFVEGPIFSATEAATGGVITLPDGTLYATGSTLLIPGTWYSIATYFRFLVSGTGTVSVDGRDITGSVTGNLSSYIVSDSTGELWRPDLAFNTAFRINTIAGTPIIEYLP